MHTAVSWTAVAALLYSVAAFTSLEDNFPPTARVFMQSGQNLPRVLTRVPCSLEDSPLDFPKLVIRSGGISPRFVAVCPSTTKPQTTLSRPASPTCAYGTQAPSQVTNSETRFRSWDLGVMSPARFRCAISLPQPPNPNQPHTTNPLPRLAPGRTVPSTAHQLSHPCLASSMRGGATDPDGMGAPTFPLQHHQV